VAGTYRNSHPSDLEALFKSQAAANGIDIHPRRDWRIGLLQSIDASLHSRKLRSFDEPPFR
jgi:hypothetical protein